MDLKMLLSADTSTCSCLAAPPRPLGSSSLSSAFLRFPLRARLYTIVALRLRHHLVAHEQLVQVGRHRVVHDERAHRELHIERHALPHELHRGGH